MNLTKRRLLLADDDLDDCIFFKEALDDLSLNTSLVTVHDGDELMKWLLNKENDFPELLFLDLNMPRKSGYECLMEIKQNERLKYLPVIIFSTSFDQTVVNSLFDQGALYYIRKPGEFSKLREVIQTVLTLISDTDHKQPSQKMFVINDQ
jgi:CheY-like chemotaxis protein